MFVEIDIKKYRSWGIGKVDGLDGSTATVAFFDSPVEERIKVEVSSKNLRKVQLASETRVYWQDEDDATWRVGRVRHQDGEHAVVRFPNREDRILLLEDLYVRWDRPVSDPTDYLSQRITETPLFADARSAFMRAWVEQRGAAQGMSGLLSSVVDLETHQIEVIRRVLQDPVQRYLLADEVGLGKTIEAGVLIRQYVIDQPIDHSVVVIVPPGIVGQWRDELTRRFLLGAYLDTSVHVASLSDPPEKLIGLSEQAGMLVIDEAHHLSQDLELYDALKKTIIGAPRLLLLSATPVLGNERGFLAMLHLLDPVVYSIGEQDAFRKRIEVRQSMAETVAGLIPDNVLQLDFYLDQFDELFPQDKLLHLQIERLRTILDDLPDEADPEFLSALNSLRSHISETYRLDRRILRNRRKSVPGLTPCRSGVQYIDHSSGSTERLVFAIEAWRAFAAAAIYGIEDTPAGKSMALWFGEFLTVLTTDRARAVEVIQERIQQIDAIDLADEIELLKDVQLCLQESSLDAARFSSLADFLMPQMAIGGTKFVLFCSSEDNADALTTYLQQCGMNGVDRYMGVVTSEDVESTCKKFLEEAEHQILVCDRYAEEGLNLQGGKKVVVHVDLPLEPNRIEQRLGRVDRYGSGSAVESVVLRCTDDPLELAWCECLEHGLGVFGSSIASLQYLVEKEISDLRDALLTEGIEAVNSLTTRLGGPDGMVAVETRRIDDQDALDALATPTEDTLDRLVEVDSNWLMFQENIHQWFVQTLQLGMLDVSHGAKLPSGDSIARYQLRRGDWGPETLIPLRKFIGEFLSVLDFDAPQASSKNLLTFPYTCRRATALSQKARAENVRLLRYGEDFLEGLNAITSIDDRGRSVSMWRSSDSYDSDERADIFIRFDFIVEADVSEAGSHYKNANIGNEGDATRALKRRGDMLYPPFYRSIWLDGGLNVVVDDGLQDLLSLPYSPRESVSKYTDTNINNRRWPILSSLNIPVMDYWSDWVTQARDAAENALRSDCEHVAQSEAAIEHARVEDVTRFAQLRARLDSSNGESKDEQDLGLAIERSVADSLYRGLAKPVVTLDTVMAIFLSGEKFPVAQMSHRD